MNNPSCSTNSSCGFSCPITGFKFCFNKKFLLGALVMIVWMNLFSWVWHGNIMTDLYQQTANLWRAPTEMKVACLNLGISLMAIISAFIFMKGYEGQGWREGLRFGILMTLLFLGMGLITNATQPIPAKIIQMWALGDLISYTVGGILLSFVSCKAGSCSEKTC